MSSQYLLWYLVTVLLGQHLCQYGKVIKHMNKLMLHKISRAGMDPVFYYLDIYSQQWLDIWIIIAKTKHSRLICSKYKVLSNHFAVMNCNRCLCEQNCVFIVCSAL